MQTLILFGLENSVYTRIARIALEEKGLDYRFEQTDIFAETGPPENYLKKQPFGKIPCLIHNNFTLYETEAITRYIDEAFADSSLQPDGPRHRGRMNQIISVLDSYGYRAIIWDVFVERVVVVLEGGTTDESRIAAALPKLEVLFLQLESWLMGGEYFCGEHITLADLHAFPMLAYFVITPEGKAMLGKAPSLSRWMNTMATRPSVVATRYNRYGAQL